MLPDSNKDHSNPLWRSARKSLRVGRGRWVFLALIVVLGSVKAFSLLELRAVKPSVESAFLASVPTGNGSEHSRRPGWTTVPGTKLAAVCPRSTGSYNFSYYCRDVIRGWSGAIADTKRSRLIIWGGGHNGYYGNELYSFDLNTLQMQRLNDPSPIADGTGCPASLVDGKPNARHTYGGIAYIAHADRMFAFSGSVANRDGCQTQDTWTLDLATLKWKRMDPVNGEVPMAGHPVADYDANTGHVFVHDQWRHLYSYDYDSNRYRMYPQSSPRALRMMAVIDPKRRLFLMFGDKGSPDGGGLRVYDLGPKSNFVEQDWTNLTKGCDPLMESNFPGLAYDARIDRIVGWPNFGNTVFLFDPDTKQCQAETYTGGPPDSAHEGRAPYSNGTFGRFRYFPSNDTFVLVNDWDVDVHLLRLRER